MTRLNVKRGILKVPSSLSVVHSASRRHKRTRSDMRRNDDGVDDSAMQSKAGSLSPRYFYQTKADSDHNRNNFRGLPPAKELEKVWDGFLNESYRHTQLNPLMKEMRQEPIFSEITVLSLENFNIEKIFEYLRPCINLNALYLTGNKVITRDLVQI